MVVASAIGWTPGYQLPSSISTWPLPQSSMNGLCGGLVRLRATVSAGKGRARPDVAVEPFEHRLVGRHGAEFRPVVDVAVLGVDPEQRFSPRYGAIFMPVALLAPMTIGTRSGSSWLMAARTRSRLDIVTTSPPRPRQCAAATAAGIETEQPAGATTAAPASPA